MICSICNMHRCTLSVDRICCPPHQQASSHLLVEVIDPLAKRPPNEVVPCIVGCSIPWCSQDETHYALFMLTHFFPFSASEPIRMMGRAMSEMYDSAELSDRRREIIKN